MTASRKFLKLWKAWRGNDETRISEHFGRFLEQTFGVTNLPEFTFRNIDWDRFDETAENDLLRISNDCLQTIAELTHKDAGGLAAGWLTEELDENQSHLDAVGFEKFTNQRFTVEYDAHKFEDPERDCVYVKLNHGFWEDLYALFVADTNRDRPRRLELDVSRAGTLESGFLLAIVNLLDAFAVKATDGIHLADVHFSVSFTNGTRPMTGFVQSFAETSPLYRAVAEAAVVGAAGFFQKLFGMKHIHLADGCFPKFGYLNGDLGRVLERHASASDRIIFVVPPHLRNIRLAAAGSVRQEVIHVPRETVHESWVACLWDTASHILKQMLNGERVLVISQCGPFTVLLGLYLAKAAKDLAPAHARLSYFDLGQVTDIANPDQSGPWLKNYDIKGDALFVLEPQDTESPATPDR